MRTAAVLHSEWLKIRTMRSLMAALIAVFAVTAGITVLVNALTGADEAGQTGDDPLFAAFFGLNFGQVAAIAFGTLAVSSEYVNGALRVSLAAVPDRTRFYAAKAAVVGSLVLLVGVVTGFVTFLGGQAFVGERALGLGDPGAVRACVGSGLYLALMALFAAGLAAVLRSGTAVLSVLVPFVLIVSFVVGDVASGVADYLPDQAGQLVVHQDTPGIGPWTGLAVTAGWAAAALLAGWFAVRRRDA
ncbi:ABC transporter permease [Streptomyces sp. NPDC049837]|uniref:ABC transporter permease n=1 Tax=Streptomyces sp. NPDC049837 TaxID=3155277 RepID=UPI0034491272